MNSSDFILGTGNSLVHNPLSPSTVVGFFGGTLAMHI